MLKARRRPVIFLAAIVAVIFIGLNIVRHLFGGVRRFAGGFRQGGGYGFAQGGMMGQGRGGMMGMGRGFGPHAMYGMHQGGGFHIFGCLIFLIVLAAIVILAVRGLRRKAKGSSMKHLIDTPFESSHTPISNMNGSILDQWEKSILEKKENDDHGSI